MRVLAVIVVAVLAVGTVVPGASADHGDRNVPWTAALPPAPTDQAAPESAARRCGPDGLRCVRRVERTLARYADRFGCDHRGVFALTYLLLTREIRLQLERDPAFFDDPAGLGLEAERFLAMYRAALSAYAHGEPLPDAWRIALDAATQGDHHAGQDMLLAISAHVQHDMPFAVAAVGLRLPDGRSRKPDHDRMNVLLSRAYDTIVPAVAARFDPFMTIADGGPSPVDDVASSQLVAGWREGVWRNAERLVAADSPEERRAVVASIEANARAWAEAIAAGEMPGYRAFRDVYCWYRGSAADPTA